MIGFCKIGDTIYRHTITKISSGRKSIHYNCTPTVSQSVYPLNEYSIEASEEYGVFFGVGSATQGCLVVTYKLFTEQVTYNEAKEICNQYTPDMPDGADDTYHYSWWIYAESCVNLGSVEDIAWMSLIKPAGINGVWGDWGRSEEERTICYYYENDLVETDPVPLSEKHSFTCVNNYLRSWVYLCEEDPERCQNNYLEFDFRSY